MGFSILTRELSYEQHFIPGHLLLLEPSDGSQYLGVGPGDLYLLTLSHKGWSAEYVWGDGASSTNVTPRCASAILKHCPDLELNSYDPDKGVWHWERPEPISALASPIVPWFGKGETVPWRKEGDAAPEPEPSDFELNPFADRYFGPFELRPHAGRFDAGHYIVQINSAYVFEVDARTRSVAFDFIAEALPFKSARLELIYRSPVNRTMFKGVAALTHISCAADLPHWQDVSELVGRSLSIVVELVGPYARPAVRAFLTASGEAPKVPPSGPTFHYTPHLLKSEPEN